MSNIAEDEDGGYWLSCTNGLFRLFDGKLQKEMEGNVTTGIAEVAPNILLGAISRPGGGRFDVVRAEKKHGAWKVEVIASVKDQIYFHLQRDGTVLWIRPDGVGEFAGGDAARWAVGKVPPMAIHYFRYPPGTALPTSVLKDRFGCIWWRNRQNAWYQCPSDRRASVLAPEIVGRGSNALLEISDGSILIPSFDSLLIGRPGKFRTISVANGYPSAGGAVVGRDDTLWISNANGLFAYSPRLNMEFWTERDGLGGNTWSILPLGRKTFAIAGEQIRMLDRNRARWLPFATLPLGTHLAPGPGDSIFASSQTQGIAQIDSEGRILRRSPAPSESMLARSRDGRLWALGNQVVNVSAQGAHLVLSAARGDRRLGRGADMKVDQNGGVWACTSLGFVRKDTSGWRVLAASDSLLKEPCSSFAVDGEQGVWYGYSQPIPGFSLLEHPDTNPQLRYFPEGDDVGVARTHFFGVDRRGWLWRGTPDGVYVAGPAQARQRQWLQLNRANGLPGVDTNQRSFVADPDGSVWFGIDDSVIHMAPPDDFVRPAYAPDVFVSGLSWNGGTFHLANLVNQVESGAAVTAYIGSLQFDRRNAVRVRYRLLPEQTAWKTQRALDVTLGKLPWGTHRLEVQARLGSGPWSKTVEKSFTVLQPLWLSWSALLGFALVAGATSLSGYRWQHKRKRRLDVALPSLTKLRGAALSPEMPELSGAVLDGRFEVGKELEQGGFATVFEGRCLHGEQRPCAIKVFRRDLVDGNVLEEGFRKEVITLQQIEHPNIVRIYGYGVMLEGAPYLVMELIRGMTLRKRLSASRLSRREIASYLRQIGSALATLHVRGIAHRDVKPENVMIRHGAEAGRELVLIDFSIALVKDPERTMQGLTRAGTVHYMASEQSIGCAETSSDIYSLAKVVIEMLTGQRISALLPQPSIDLPSRVPELLDNQNLLLRKTTIESLSSALEFHPRARPADVRYFVEGICWDLESEYDQRI